MEKPVILIGYGGHGMVAADILLEAGYRLQGYCDNEEKTLNPFSIPYKGTEEGFFLNVDNRNNYAAFIAVGNSTLRENIYKLLQLNRVNIINAIHPKAVVSKKTRIGNGVFIAAKAVVSAMSIVGDGVVCNTSSSIDHECVIGNFSHICPGTVLCGNVVIGKNSFIGANSTIIPGKKIGDGVIVGAGSTVIDDLLLPGLYVGSPAKLIKKHR